MELKRYAILHAYAVDLKFMLDIQGVNKLKQNPKELERIVKNHLVKGQVRSEDLAGRGLSLTNYKQTLFFNVCQMILSVLA